MGGSETVLLTLAREQKRLGHDVTICCLFGEGPLDGKAAAYGIPVVHLRSANRRLAKIRSLYRYLGTARYDVLHSHWGVWLATAVAGSLRGTPCVHTNHSNQPRRWAPEHRVACFFTPKVVSLTPEIEPYLAKWVGVPKRKIVVIPNGIDFARIENARRVEVDGIPAEVPVVGMVARLSPPKDYATYLQAVKLVGKERPAIQFVSIGEGPQRAHYEAMARELQLTNHRFLGGRGDVPDLLRRFTVFVLCTKHEGHPMSVVEALASGCPVIASDIPPVRFTVDGGACGLLVPENNPQALSAQIIRLVEDTRLQGELRTRGLLYAQRFRSEVMAQRYMDLYQTVTA